MRSKWFYILLCVLMGCSSSKEIMHSPTTLDLWDLLSFTPESAVEIAGEYIFSWDLGGGHLKLNDDGTYLRKEYTDVYDPTNIVEGFTGSYQIVKDTLFLNFKSFALDTNMVHTPSFADSVIYGNMSAMYFPPTTDTSSIASKFQGVLELQNRFREDEQFERFHEMNYYFIKRLGEVTFLVKSTARDFFLDQIEQKNGLWTDNLKNGKKYFKAHFSKVNSP